MAPPFGSWWGALGLAIADHQRDIMNIGSRLPYAIVALAAAVVVVVAWVTQLPSPEPGSPAPSFTAYELDGREASLEDYEGNVILLNIWATWCPPCRYEMPSMQRLYDHFEDEPFEIVAVSVDSPPGEADADGNPGGDVEAFVNELGLTFPILHDPDQGIQRTYQSPWLPESFVIGMDGVIYRKVAGATEWDEPRYKELIQRLLDEGRGEAQ